jgi:nuclear autoantigenic sperm protein
MVSPNDEVISEVPAAEAAEIIKAISEEDFEKAQKTFQSGKKNLFLNKYDESVNNIGDACKIYSAKFGEFDPQCAEVYFFYGRALLELARVENTVLGNALNGVPEDTEPIDDSRYGNPEEIPADEKKEISEKVIDALCSDDAAPAVEEVAAAAPAAAETNGEAKPATEEKIEVDGEAAKVEAEKPVEIKEGEAAVTTTTETKAENGEAAPAAEGEAAEEEEEEEEEEDEDLTKNDEQVKDEAEAEEISNLQRSWEMFELAKLVYTKNFDNDLPFKNKRIAECLLKLGEISIEQEIYEQAITDISESIKLQEELKEQRDERMLAESFYQLGLAQQFNNLFTEANESYQKSINIMQLRIEKLKGKLETIGNDADSESEKKTVEDEITELEALLPEMLSKLEEVNEQGQQSLTLIKEAKECFANKITTETKLNGNAETNGEVKDITNMVKSKRKINEVTEESSTIKKTRLSGSEELEAEISENAPVAAAATTENGEKVEIAAAAVEAEPIKIDEPAAVTAPVEEKIAEPIQEAPAATVA